MRPNKCNPEPTFKVIPSLTVDLLLGQADVSEARGQGSVLVHMEKELSPSLPEKISHGALSEWACWS